MLLHLTQTPLAHTPRRTQHAPSPAIPHDISASTRAKTHTQTRLLGLFTLRAERERGRDAPARPLQRNTTAFGKRERERERERQREREREKERERERKREREREREREIDGETPRWLVQIHEFPDRSVAW
jgi:hypothetical protein